MNKYAIYKYTDGYIKYGKIPDYGDFVIIEEFSHFNRCSAEFHAGNRAQKIIFRLFKRATADRAGEDTLAIMRSCLTGEGWPDAPYMRTAFDRLEVAQNSLVAFNRARAEYRVQQIGAPLPGSTAAMSEEEKEALRKSAVSRGFTPRF